MAEKLDFLILRVKIIPAKIDSFINWQTDLHREIAGAVGFDSLEILSPVNSSDSWKIVMHFSDEECAHFWKDSPQCEQLMARLSHLTDEKEMAIECMGHSNSRNGVTEVFITNVPVDKEEVYREWIAKIHRVEAQFPGFCGVYVQPPTKKVGGNWITLLKFDTQENLDHWLLSKERKDLLDESLPMIGSLETHRVISLFGSWFSNPQGSHATGEPPLWKQTMVILLLLYPIVMLEFQFLSPLTKDWHFALATFLGNALSVSLLSWPLLPMGVRFLRWWLFPEGKKSQVITILGTFLMIALYAAEVTLFWAWLK